MPPANIVARLLVAGTFALVLTSAAAAQDRTCFICNVDLTATSITGPTVIPVGQDGSWTGTATLSFDYDLQPGETITFSAQALTFPEFTPPDPLYPAEVTPYTTIACEPDCSGHGTIVASFTATGPFGPAPGKTRQNMYLMPEALLTSSSDPHLDVTAVLPIGVPYIDITVTPAPEPATWAMMLVGFVGMGVAMRSRRKLAAASA